MEQFLGITSWRERATIYASSFLSRKEMKTRLFAMLLLLTMPLVHTLLLLIGLSSFRSISYFAGFSAISTVILRAQQCHARSRITSKIACVLVTSVKAQSFLLFLQPPQAPDILPFPLRVPLITGKLCWIRLNRASLKSSDSRFIRKPLSAGIRSLVQYLSVLRGESRDSSY